MATAVEVANAYVALYAKMPGVQKDIEKSLGGSDVESAVTKSGEGVGSKFTSAIGGVVKGGLIAVGATAVAALGIALVKGFSRLQAIDEARAKLTGLGNDAESVQKIMDNALASVRGTAFGLGDAAGVAAQLVAAQIKPGEQLEGVLKAIANNAAAAGIGMGEMGSIFAKAATQANGVQNDVLSQIADRGIPIYQALADQMGVTAGEVFRLASEGKVSFDMFQAAATAAAGTVAAEMGNTVPGALDNMWAAFGRIGAGLLGGIYPYIAPLIQALTSALGPLETLAGGIGEKIAGVVGPALQWLTDTLNGGIDLTSFFELLSVLSPIGMAFRVLEPILPLLMDSFMQIGSVLGGAVSTVFAALLPVLTQIAEVFSGVLAQVLPMILPIIEQLAGVFAEVLAAVMPLVAALIGALMPVFSAIVPIIAALLPVFSQIIGLIMPIVSALLPVLTTLVEALAPIVVLLVDAFLKLLTPILALVTPLLDMVGSILPPLVGLIGMFAEMIAFGLTQALEFFLPILMGVVDALSHILVPIIDTVVAVLGGLITFLTGVFTGNWEQAWKGIVDIFSGLFNGVIDIARGVGNAVIDIINGIIGGINGLAGSVSEATGGAIDFTIPSIPRLADGGIVQARPGGIIANIGEGRYDEAVLPLSPPVLAALGGTGSGRSSQVNVYTTDPYAAAEVITQRLGVGLAGR